MISLLFGANRSTVILSRAFVKLGETEYLGAYFQTPPLRHHIRREPTGDWITEMKVFPTVSGRFTIA